jgi:hypothetical protein
MAVTQRDALTYRDVLQWRAEACAQDGLMLQATVWVMAADMCRAAFWTECFGALEAERLVGLLCRGE